MENFGEGYAHFENQKGLIDVIPTQINSDYIGNPTPKGYVAVYDINKTPLHHKIFPSDNYAEVTSLYHIKNEKFDEEKVIKLFQLHNDYFKEKDDNCVGFHCYDDSCLNGDEYIEKKSWTPCLGSNGGQMSILKNCLEKKNELGKYYLMINTKLPEMSHDLFERNKKYDSVKLKDYLEVDASNKIHNQAAYNNNTRLASWTNTLLQLGLDTETDKNICINEE